MAIIVTAVEEDYSIKNLKEHTKVFLAGGISNCPNWQDEVISQVLDIEGITVYNPRRKIYPAEDLQAVEQQIGWEYKHLQEADVLVFWFSRGSLNPITLYELGRWAHSSKKPLIMGIDPEYLRKQDVMIQTSLSRPDVMIYETFESFVEGIRNYFTELPF